MVCELHSEHIKRLSHLQRWGMLIPHLSEVDVHLLLQTSNIARFNTTTSLGTMYELFYNMEGGSSDIHIQ